ncbi:CAMK/CAMK1 protein kinase [Aphanomyces invadans]|nr:CAMK/CAMK1 protein kinase [Aphanomyces invadans]ETW05355.1 CAMK/CAMK1 protein kinase [Aphanomyces invadans]|eukprot:XP_008866793.1 CAMK/CAMK1 protein kinase [Aphanomyces invadans]
MGFSRVLQQCHRSAGLLSGGTAAAIAGVTAFYLADLPVVQADSASNCSMLIKTQSLESRYGIQKTIGRGGFAHVEAGWEKGSNTPVAIKRVSKSLTSRAKFVHEVSILRQLQGLDHVVQLKDAFETPEDWILVTEYVQGGELFDRLVQKGTFTEQHARTMTRELAQTLIDLHAKRLVHGDVKPENILLESANDSARMILIDFGLSFRASEGRHPWDGSGTVAYAAPEVQTQSSDITTAIDMWALGVVLFIVLGGYHPFDAKSELTDANVRLAILRGEFDFDHASWGGVSEDAKDLIRRLIVVDPAARLTAADVLKHPWLHPSSVAL